MGGMGQESAPPNDFLLKMANICGPHGHLYPILIHVQTVRCSSGQHEAQCARAFFWHGKRRQLLISVSSEGNPRNKSSPMIPMHTLMYTAYPLTKLSHGLIVLLLAFGAGGCSFWTNVVILPGYNQ